MEALSGISTSRQAWKINFDFEMSVFHHPCLFSKGTPETKDLLIVSAATDDLLRLMLPTAEARASMADFVKRISDGP
jgi:hypothetical protein